MSILTSRSSIPTINDGSANPPRDGDENPSKEKRRRTGKPKVRTGCVTWIRRIKCDEQKPACRRCISTGRTCDGYQPVTKDSGRASVIRHRDTFPNSSRMVPSTRPAILRPLAADFAGDMVERQYIHRWLPIAEDSVGIRERANGLFWGRIVPEYVAAFPGIRHAIVALSAAHHNFHTNGVRQDVSAPPSKLECFIINQYNKAMVMVREQVDDMETPHIKRFGVVVMACVLFFYTEILLSQWPTAMMHILNGLKVMTHLPDDIDEIYRKPERWKKVGDNTFSRATYMVRLLCRWEVTAGFLASKNRPSMSISTWKPLKQQTCSVPAQVLSLEHLCEVVDAFYQDVCAFIWLCNNNDKEEAPWDGSTFKLQYHILQQRACLVAGLLDRTRELYGDLAKATKTSEYLTYLSRCLHQRSAALCLDLIILPQGSSYPPAIDESLRTGEIMAMVNVMKEMLQKSLGGPARPPWFNVDFGIVSALYLTATNCFSLKIRRKLYNMIRDWPWQENLWDGPMLRERLTRDESIETEPDSPETQLVYR